MKNIKKELYDILCEQEGMHIEALEAVGIDGYLREGWFTEKDLFKAIHSLILKKLKDTK